MAIAILIRSLDLVRIFDVIWALTEGGPGTMTETISIYTYVQGFRQFETSYTGAIAFLIIAHPDRRRSRRPSSAWGSPDEPAATAPCGFARAAAAATARPRPRRTLRRAPPAALVVFFLFPIYWLVIMSFKTADEIFAYPPVWFPGQLQLRRTIAVLFRDGDWVDGAQQPRPRLRSRRSSRWSSARSPPTPSSASGPAARTSRSGSSRSACCRRWRSCSRSSCSTSISAGSTPSTGLIVLYVAFSLPYVIWMMRGLHPGHPDRARGERRGRRLLALADPLARGASRWPARGSSRRPSSPSSSCGTTSCSPSCSPARRSSTYTVQVTHYFGGQSNFWAKIAAMSVLGTLPVFFTVASLQRYFVRGISMGAVKG